MTDDKDKVAELSSELKQLVNKTFDDIASMERNQRIEIFKFILTSIDERIGCVEGIPTVIRNRDKWAEGYIQGMKEARKIIQDAMKVG